MPKKEKVETTSLGSIIETFNKTMGEGTIHSASEVPECIRIKSSIPAYNYVTDGGFAVGRITEHIGENGSLKSYTSYDAIAKFQHYDWANNVDGAFKRFKYSEGKGYKEVVSYTLADGYKPKLEPEYRRVVLLDVESTYTPSWGKNFGIDSEGLIILRPDSLSQGIDIAQSLLAEPTISLVVLDSMSAIGTDEEMEESMEKQQMGSGARTWNRAVRKFLVAMNANPNKGATLILMNSFYSKVGFVLGDPTTIRNGEQLKRAKTISVMFKGLKEISGKTDEGELVVGRNITLKCLKNKLGVPGRDAHFFYAYKDYGFTKAYHTDIEGQIVDLGSKFGLVERAGAWYEACGIRVNGMDRFVDELIKTGKIKELEKEVYKKMEE